jgi:hypothetical protein
VSAGGVHGADGRVAPQRVGLLTPAGVVYPSLSGCTLALPCKFLASPWVYVSGAWVFLAFSLGVLITASYHPQSRTHTHTLPAVFRA